MCHELLRARAVTLCRCSPETRKLPRGSIYTKVPLRAPLRVPVRVLLRVLIIGCREYTAEGLYTLP